MYPHNVASFNLPNTHTHTHTLHTTQSGIHAASYGRLRTRTVALAAARQRCPCDSSKTAGPQNSRFVSTLGAIMDHAYASASTQQATIFTHMLAFPLSISVVLNSWFQLVICARGFRARSSTSGPEACVCANMSEEVRNQHACSSVFAASCKGEAAGDETLLCDT